MINLSNKIGTIAMHRDEAQRSHISVLTNTCKCRSKKLWKSENNVTEEMKGININRHGNSSVIFISIERETWPTSASYNSVDDRWITFRFYGIVDVYLWLNRCYNKDLFSFWETRKPFSNKNNRIRRGVWKNNDRKG